MNNFIITKELIFILGTISWFMIRGSYLFFIRRKDGFVKEISINLFSIYIIALISVTLFPINIQMGKEIIFKAPVIWVKPIESFYKVIRGSGMGFALYHAVGNLILLSPLAFFCNIFWKDKFDSIIKILLLCFCSTCLIESIQFIESILIPGVQRYIEINDILFNTISGIWGYLAYKFYNFICCKKNIKNDLYI